MIQDSQGKPVLQCEPKEMLSIRRALDGKDEIRINHSSYSLISACKKKAYFALERGLVKQHESEALIFGRAVHAALEVWYTASIEFRRNRSSLCNDSIALMESGQAPIAHGRCVRCAAISAFFRVAEPLRVLESSDKRSLRNGAQILEAYFDVYAEDPFEVLTDSIGPLCERTLEIVLTEDEETRVIFFGTLDAVLRNTKNGHIVLCDHKTTSALGQDFLQRIRPNWQYTAYMAAFRATYPEHDTRTFMSNGILVAKTKQSFARQFCEVDEGLISEWRISLLDLAYDWYARVKTKGPFPMNAPDPCCMWGACQYRTICEIPLNLQENVITANYKGTLNE